MPDESLHQPHDKIFKWTFSPVAAAIAVFLAYLPERLTRHFDFRRAELVQGSFIDEHFRGLESDLLYRIPFAGKVAFVYYLFEHQGKADRWMARRLHSYMARIWEQFGREHPGAQWLPVIVPIVLIQQPEGGRQETNFGALFDLNAEQRADLARVIPDFQFAIIELARLPYEQIVGTPMGIITLRVLKAQPMKALLGEAVWDEALLSRLSPADQRVVLRYILALGEVDREGFARKVEQLREPELRRDAMTLAEQFIQEGVEKGLAKGRQEGRQEGREEGREEGVLIGRIQLLQNLLGRAVSPIGQLEGRSLEELRALDDEFRQALG